MCIVYFTVVPSKSQVSFEIIAYPQNEGLLAYLIPDCHIVTNFQILSF